MPACMHARIRVCTEVRPPECCWLPCLPKQTPACASGRANGLAAQVLGTAFWRGVSSLQVCTAPFEQHRRHRGAHPQSDQPYQRMLMTATAGHGHCMHGHRPATPCKGTALAQGSQATTGQQAAHACRWLASQHKQAHTYQTSKRPTGAGQATKAAAGIAQASRHRADHRPGLRGRECVAACAVHGACKCACLVGHRRARARIMRHPHARVRLVQYSKDGTSPSPKAPSNSFNHPLPIGIGCNHSDSARRANLRQRQDMKALQ